MWLKKTLPLPTTPTEYPAGTFIKTEAGYFYIVDQAKRFRIMSKRCLDSWSPQRVANTTEAAVVRYRISSKLRFRNGSLIWNISDGRIYLIENGKRCWVKNPEWFYTLGLDPADLRFNMSKVMCVSQADLNLHELGEDLE